MAGVKICRTVRKDVGLWGFLPADLQSSGTAAWCCHSLNALHTAADPPSLSHCSLVGSIETVVWSHSHQLLETIQHCSRSPSTSYWAQSYIESCEVKCKVETLGKLHTVLNWPNVNNQYGVAAFKDDGVGFCVSVFTFIWACLDQKLLTSKMNEVSHFYGSKSLNPKYKWNMSFCDIFKSKRQNYLILTTFAQSQNQNWMKELSRVQNVTSERFKPASRETVPSPPSPIVQPVLDSLAVFGILRFELITVQWQQWVWGFVRTSY